MEKTELKIGQILQINPESETNFPGFLMVVTETKSFGAMGYLLHTGDFSAVRHKEKAFVRVKFENVEHCGFLQWISQDETETEND